jgi:ABC-type branched-subunit amino acid transport system substrate-binding protein
MAAGAAAAAAAVAQAIKASGVVVRVEPEEFLKIVRRTENPLVVVAPGGFFSRGYQYLASYKGLAFFTKSPDPLPLPPGAEIVEAGSIWIPR